MAFDENMLIPKEDVIAKKEDVVSNKYRNKKKKSMEGSRYKKRTMIKGEEKIKKSGNGEYAVFRKGLSESYTNGLSEKKVNRLLEMTNSEVSRLKKVKNLEWSITGIRLDSGYQKLLEEYLQKTNKDARNLKTQRLKLAELLSKFKKKT